MGWPTGEAGNSASRRQVVRQSDYSA